MDTNKNNQPSNSQGNDSIRKRGSLENLSKEELVIKCKGLLGLAQKAKQAKDEYGEKNKMLLAKLSEFETQKEADKGSLLTMKEMIDSLTETKLIFTSNIVDLENQNHKLLDKIIELEKSILEQSEISIENEALKRQVQRLTDENEDLISDLEKMEAKFLQTSKEYSKQQKINEHIMKEATRKFEELQRQYSMSNHENIKFKESIEQHKTSSCNKLDADDDIMKNEIIKKIEKQNIELSNNLKEIKSKEFGLLNEIQHLKSKINDVAVKFKKLKGCRKVLMENEKDYSESVSKWQQDIKMVSQKLLAYIRTLENDKKFLENQMKLTESLSNDKEYKYLLEIEVKTNKLKKIYDKAFSENESRIKQIEELKLSLGNQKSSNEYLMKETELLKSQIVELNQNKENTVQNKNLNQKSDYNLLQKSLEDHVSKHEELKLNHSQMTLALKSTKDTCDNLKKCCAELNKEIQSKKEIEKLLKDEICDLIENGEHKNKSFKNSVEDYNQTIEKLKSKNCELLNEMTELNEALKCRGDIISRQKDTIASLEADLKRISKESSIEPVSKLNLCLYNENLKDQTFLADNQSDALSSCSITKVEDSTRMQEVNESLEEKYNKLKMLAVKMKRKIQEQRIIITSLEKKVDEKSIFSEFKDSQNSTNNQTQNLQAIETEKFLIEIKELNRKVIEQEDELKSLNNAVKVKEKVLENEIKLRKSKEQVANEKSNEIKLLKQEKDAFNLIRKELEKEKDMFKTKFCDKEKEINKLNEVLEKLKKDLEKSKAIGKQSSVLNLEIEAYEKSLNENAEKLQAIKLQNQELIESLKFKENTILSLKQEIKLLEDNVNSEKVHSAEMKQQIDIIQAKLKQIEHDKLELQTKLQDSTVENELKNSQLEELRLQISDIAARNDKKFYELVNEKEIIFDQLSETKKNLNTTESKLKVLELDLENVRTEYASYKIRAQSVLRQNQNKETSRERDLEEELTTMRANHETLNMKLEKSSEILDNQEKKIDELKQENDRIQKRSTEVLTILEESREHYDILLEENRKQSKDYQESLKSHRFQIETITNCYKEQISELEQKHSTTIEEIKKNNVTISVSRVGPFGASGVVEQPQKSSDEQKVEMLLMEREDAEGSEASYTIPKRKMSTTRSKHDTIPLDELLNSSLDENPEEIFSDEDFTVTVENEMSILKEKLQSEEIKSKHLSSLLSETEQDLIKYTQLSEVLKEELRRQERTLEREKHMPNSEYLKNVIIKFLTLNSGDERIRLVPVLNTILKLSPGEANTLQNVAKGLDTGRSWNLLPMWSNNNH